MIATVNCLDRNARRLLKDLIRAEVACRLRTGEDLNLAEISTAVRAKQGHLAGLEDLRLAFRLAAAEALKRKPR